MTGLGDRSLATFLEDLAAPTPAPGGGTSAAVATAVAAALVEMSAGIAGEAEVSARAREVRALAMRLAEEELTSYEPVLQAQRLPLGDPNRAVSIEGALMAASLTPNTIAELAAEIAELGAQTAAAAGIAVRGDAVTGTLLAESAATAAAGLVEVNLRGQPDNPLLKQAVAARGRARRARVDVS